MIIKSFRKDYFGLEPIEVEVALTKGLPQISIVGLPDTLIKESVRKIESALLAQGYQMPRARQVLVNLKPNDIRKTSLGIDLAIALGILWESEQLIKPEGDFYVYGELDLSGLVSTPKDIQSVPDLDVPVLTGAGDDELGFPHLMMERLSGPINSGIVVTKPSIFKRPRLANLSFPRSIADYIKVVALGEHPCLLAGPGGSGKTTFTQVIPSLLVEPSGLCKEIQKIGRYFNERVDWRPVVNPHHTATAISLVGGGAPPRPGELVRAHGGVLVLDELLEFNTKVQSALREPLEQKTLSLSRGSYHRKFPCDFLVLATTNLCRCGEFVPSHYNKCRCSSRHLKNYMEKLSGPFVDRFGLLLLTQDWSALARKEDLVSLNTILEELNVARSFVAEGRGQKTINERLSEKEVTSTFKSKVDYQFLPEFKSRRRRNYFFKLARTFADIESSEMIEASHVQKSLKVTYESFNQVRDYLSF